MKGVEKTIMFNEEKGNDIMKKYTQEEFNDFEMINGRKLCPVGDYSEIRLSDNPCRFESDCRFGDCKVFAKSCIFGARCEFGYYCEFDMRCKLGERCQLGAGCRILEFCSFECKCVIGSHCRFNSYCKFDADCMFGHECLFEQKCKFEAGCRFDNCCEFKKECVFGHGCLFGDFCSLSIDCKFGDSINFGIECCYEDLRVISGEIRIHNNIGAENKSVYIYINKMKRVFLRIEDFFGDLKDFKLYCLLFSISKDIEDICIELFLNTRIEVGKQISDNDENPSNSSIDSLMFDVDPLVATTIYTMSKSSTEGECPETHVCASNIHKDKYLKDVKSCLDDETGAHYEFTEIVVKLNPRQYKAIEGFKFLNIAAFMDSFYVGATEETFARLSDRIYDNMTRRVTFCGKEFILCSDPYEDTTWVYDESNNKALNISPYFLKPGKESSK